MATMMDDALSYAMLAIEMNRPSRWRDNNDEWKRAFSEGKDAEEVLKGYMVTANLNIRYFRPVVCPGIVGIEVGVVEDSGMKMKLRAVMKDGEGKALAQADGLWVRLGEAKL
ncbi:hypothetical protein K469DRAFT_721269 [Zopfia rhizophila CBS 207.26]|uniref:Thioesterase domain-containing protein n=1 Tax=Zopfia rhizophila CBS 207.26 TaxID=1314779 RepID=A0A6A6EJV4_9PEZI|nr:hypothetical protein K469DRAFT_721269 [Zopfia rhizophila CBS 207.26]